MKLHSFFLGLGLLPFLFCNVLSHAEEPGQSFDSVLEKWEKASQECKILDAKLKLYHHDAPYQSDEPRVRYGRFYYESPNIGTIEIGKKPIDEAKDWSADEFTLIWNGTESIRIEPKERTYLKVPIEKIQKLRDQPHEGFFAKLGYGLTIAALPPLRPQTLWPLIVDVRAKEIRQQFEISFERQNDEILITAVPKKNVSQMPVFFKIRVLLDANTFQTKAVQYIDNPGNSSSLVLYDQKVNEKPSDRDQLIDPDLSGFRAEENIMPFGQD